MKSSRPFIILGIVIALLGLCATGAFVALGSGLALFMLGDSTASNSAAESAPTRRPVEAASLPTVTSTPATTASPTATPIPLPTDTPTATATASPTAKPTPLPTDTPSPDTPTPTATSAPPTATPLPTETPSPTAVPYAFIIKEQAGFETNHLNFDVYIAVVDGSNKPLPDYRIVGTHSSGMQVESHPTANDWTENSGAMHYKGGNLKYEVMNSPDGDWTLQLVGSDGVPVAPPVTFPFDSANPHWYFLIYERQ